TVVGRGGEEPHVRAEVVAACEALPATAARNPRLDRNPLPRAQRGHLGSDIDDDAAGFVPEDERGVDYVGADPAVFVVMHVRSADPDLADLDQHLTPARRGNLAFLDADVTGL